MGVGLRWRWFGFGTIEKVFERANSAPAISERLCGNGRVIEVRGRMLNTPRPRKCDRGLGESHDDLADQDKICRGSVTETYFSGG